MGDLARPVYSYAHARNTLSALLAPDFAQDEVGTVTDAELCEQALNLVAGRFDRQVAVAAVPLDHLPPLYEWDLALSDWKSNLSRFTAQEARAWVDRETRRCVQDLAYWATHYACTRAEHSEHDEGIPRAEIIPAWGFVLAVLGHLNQPANIIIEKSRDMMMSWLTMACATHDVLFRRDWSVMTMSRVEMLVDNGGEKSTVDSLHGKIRYIHENQPPFLRFPLTFKYLQVRNDATRASIQGFSTTISAGRGPKYRRAFMDEWAWVPNSEEVMTSVTRACPRGKVLVSTPHGQANNFFRIRTLARGVYPQEEENTKPHLKQQWLRITVHWSVHPDRDQAWYDAECASGSMTPEAVAQELDISYEHSIVGRVYPKFTPLRHVAGAPLAPLDAVVYDAQRPLVVTCDFNHDPLVWLICQRFPEVPYFRVLGQIMRRNAIYADGARELIVRYGSDEALRALLAEHPDAIKVYGGGGVQLAGPEGHCAELQIHGDATEEKSTVHSRVKLYAAIRAMLEQAGFRVTMRVPTTNPPIPLRIETVNDCLAKNLAILDPSAEELSKDFLSGVWAKSTSSKTADMDQRTEDDDGSGLTRSHASSAFGYWIVTQHRVLTSAHATSRARDQDISALVRRWR